MSAETKTCCVEGCSRKPQAELEGFCLGHFYWRVLEPRRGSYEKAREAYVAVLARTPKAIRNIEITETRDRGPDREF